MRHLQYARRFVYTYDPALIFIDTFWRTLVCMGCIFLGSYLIGPLLGMSVPMAIGGAGGLMPISQELAGVRTRRAVIFSALATLIGVVLGSLIMVLCEGITILQIAFLVLTLCLNFKWKSIHRHYGQTVVKALTAAGILCLIMSRFVTSMWEFLETYLLLTLIIVGIMSVLMGAFVRYPSQVMRDAKMSLRFAHESSAYFAARLLRNPSKRNQWAMNRCIIQNHRCAVACEAAMVEMASFPARIGEEIHRHAFDSDLTFMRLARIVTRLAGQRGPSAQKLQKRLAELMELLSGREPSALALATDLAGGFRKTLRETAADFDRETYALVKRIPLLVESLISEIVDSGVAHAEADHWMRLNAQQLRQIQRQKDNAWFLHPWLKVQGRRGKPLPLPEQGLVSPRLQARESWVPLDLEQVRREVSRVQQGEQDYFQTGFNYVELRHGGEVPAVTQITGKLKWGPIAIGLSERQFLQALIAISCASLVGWFLTDTHFFWASFGAFVVLIGTTTTSSRFRKTIKRVVGTAAGAGIGYLVIWITGSNLPLLNLGIAAIFAAVAFTIVKSNYSVFSVLLTATIMQIYLLSAAPLHSYALGRVAENALGAVIAGAVASFVLPLHTSDLVRSLLSTLEQSLLVVMEDAKQILSGELLVHPLLDARLVENAGLDLTKLARSLLGSRTGTSHSWVRRVASHVPALSTSTAALAVLLEEMRVSHLHGDFSAAGQLPVLGAKGSSDQKAVGQQVRDLVDLVIVDVQQLGVVKGSVGGGSKIGQPGQFVYLAEDLLVRIQQGIAEGQNDLEIFEELVNRLIRVDEAARNLTRMAWG